MCITWGWAGDGASEFWDGCWLCSCRWGTAGLDPAPPPAPSCAPGPWWVRAAFSLYKDTQITLHEEHFTLSSLRRNIEKQLSHNTTAFQGLPPTNLCQHERPSHHLGLGVQAIPRRGGWAAAGPANWRPWNPRDVRHRVQWPRKLQMTTHRRERKRETDTKLYILRKTILIESFFIHLCQVL